MSRKRMSLAVLVIACGVLSFVGYSQINQRAEEESRKEQSEAIAARLKAEFDSAKKLPHADLDMDRVPKAYPRPPSAWHAAERTFYRSVLGKGHFDVLVVPFQVQDHAFARDLRSLMTAKLALEIAAAGTPSIADPYLVARALGESERRIELMEVFSLANSLDAKRIVLGYVGHNDKNEMRLTLHYYDRVGPGNFSETYAPRRNQYGHVIPSDKLHSQHFENVAYSDVDTPIDAYYRLLPGMLRFLGLGTAEKESAKAISRFDASDLPPSPIAISSNKSEPARDAYYFQLLAALVPTSAERVRERFIEKSMLAIESMSPESPDYRALRARALMNMGLRPAAIQTLGTPASAEEKHLLAMLNGNLPDVQNYRPRIPGGVRAVIAALEENSIAAAYGAREQKKSLEAVKTLKLPGEVWQFFAARAMTDWDQWMQHENIHLKAVLDREFPIEGLTAEAMIRGATAVADMSKIQTATDLSVLDHVRKQTEKAADKWCCQALATQPGPFDYLDLIDGIGTDNLVRRAKFHTSTQGRPEDSVQFLAKIEGTYKDHPQFAVARAEAQLAMAKNAAGTEREDLLRSAYTTAFNVWYWEQGQTRPASDAFSDVMSRAGRRDYGVYDNVYANDYPYRPFYSYWQLPGDFAKNARAALRYSTFDFEPVRQMEWSQGQVAKQWNEVDELLKSIEDRFKGHPKRTELMAQSSVRRGDAAAAERFYREGIAAQPGDTSLYSQLGKLLFEGGAVQRSAEVFMSYPGLKNRSGVHPVGLANYAYEAGSLYYWSGEFTQAIPLYKVAAELSTGAGSSMASESRLSLLDGDYISALRGSLERARRYNSPHAYRDYLGLLHAMGYSKEAWDGFTALVGKIDAPQVWETALVGHRLQGATEADVAAWVAQEPMRTAGKMYAYAPIYLLRAGVIDRTPTKDLPALIAAVERPVWQVQAQFTNVVRPTTDPTVQIVLTAPAEAILPLGVFDVAPKTRVKSDLVYFAEAYRALRSGDFDASRAAFQDAVKLFNLRNESLGYLLPYYGYAAARSKELTAIEALLDQFAVEYQRFDYHLAKAAIAGVTGKTDDSMEHLKLALHRRPFTEQRPIYTEYQYAELCELLFDATRNPRYREKALTWAKKFQTIQPWFAWAYAMEARLTTNANDRRRATAMAYYLDRNSERLASIPRADIKAAVREFAKRNPFLRTTDSVRKEPT
jgi:tetratricopeptide (TPR) repeat protein